MTEITKLSEAIREGAKKRPMGLEDYFVEFEGLLSCALGAAYEAIRGQPGEDHDEVSDCLETAWPWIFQRGWHISRTGIAYTLVHVIALMNDSGKFTREEIADWLESIGE